MFKLAPWRDIASPTIQVFQMENQFCGKLAAFSAVFKKSLVLNIAGLLTSQVWFLYTHTHRIYRMYPYFVTSQTYTCFGFVVISLASFSGMLDNIDVAFVAVH